MVPTGNAKLVELNFLNLCCHGAPGNSLRSRSHSKLNLHRFRGKVGCGNNKGSAPQHCWQHTVPYVPIDAQPHVCDLLVTLVSSTEGAGPVSFPAQTKIEIFEFEESTGSYQDSKKLHLRN